MNITAFGCAECPACVQAGKFLDFLTTKHPDIVAHKKLTMTKPDLRKIVNEYNLSRTIPFFQVNGEWKTEKEFNNLFIDDYAEFKKGVKNAN